MVVGVFTGAKVVNKPFREKLLGKLNRKEITFFLKNSFLNLIFYWYGRGLSSEKVSAEKFYFGNQKKTFFNENSHLIVDEVDTNHRSVNEDYYVNKIKTLRPDIIVVMGTWLLGKEILSSAKIVLNLHTGLSPYYRGGNTNLWPIIENDFGYFGVTIHKMSTGIDSGDIVHSGRPEVKLEDNYGTINCKSIILGTEMIIDAINLVIEKKLKSKKQWIRGRLFLNKKWNNYMAFKYFQNKQNFFQNCLYKDRFEDIKLIKNGTET